MPADRDVDAGTARQVRRAAERFLTVSEGVRTWHCFSFGRHYDPAHVAHGRLLVHDEHLLAPGAGFDPHPHRDVDVLSWVLEGALVHSDGGQAVEVPEGRLQRMRTGSGVVHAEHAGGLPTRFVQLWLRADPGAVPSYDQVAVGDLDEVLPGVHAGSLTGRWELPAAPRAHVFVAGGACVLDDVPLLPGDSVRLTAAGRVPLRADAVARLLVVELPED